MFKDITALLSKAIKDKNILDQSNYGNLVNIYDRESIRLSNEIRKLDEKL
jgi:hypothetical protein